MMEKLRRLFVDYALWTFFLVMAIWATLEALGII